MHKTIVKKVRTEQYFHEFYCDDCNKYLGKSIEYDDGWFETYGEYEQHFYVNGYGWCKLKKTLCDECKDKMNTKILLALKDIGFMAENKAIGLEDVEILGGTE